MRGRYYASAMDIDQLRRGEAYRGAEKELRHLHLHLRPLRIGAGCLQLPELRCQNHLPYGDESFKLIVNTTAPAENTPRGLVPFFDYINRMEVPDDDAFIKALHAQVEKVQHFGMEAEADDIGREDQAAD